MRHPDLRMSEYQMAGLGAKISAGLQCAGAMSGLGQGQPPRWILEDLAVRPVDPTIADTAAAPVRLVGVCL